MIGFIVAGLIIRAGTSVADARAALADSGHTRSPVIDSRDLDDVAGVVLLRDLLDGSTVRTSA